MYGLYDFPRIDAEDLPFEKAEILVIIKQPDERWWSTRNKDSRVGMLLIPFVRRLARGVAHRVL